MTAQIARLHYNRIEEGTGRRYRLDNLTAPGAGSRGHPKYEFLGVVRYWRYAKTKMEQLYADGRVMQTAPGRVPAYKRYLDEMPGAAVGDSWDDIPPINSQAKERLGYPTQKPVALLQRIVRASCPDDGVVLDPFCGCATACIAAEVEHRQWTGIDIAPKAAELVRVRMKKELGMFYDGVHRTDVPRRTDIGPIPHYKTHRKTLYGEQGGHCNGCGEHFKPQNLTVDHIIPRAKGGTDHLGNLQLLCGYCNSVKGDRGHEYLMAKLAA